MTKRIIERLRPQYGPQRSTKRGIDDNDVHEAIKAVRRAKNRVRVYSAWGFVPNSYKWRCEIQYIDAIRGDNGWKYTTGWTGAQRRGGSGSLVVIDGRPA